MLTIVILVHNHAAMTRDCLASLGPAAADTPAEVVCVDNASTEDLDVAVNARCDLPVKWLRNDCNLSFSAANNRAVRESNGELLLFLNNDVVAQPGAIDRMRATFADPLVGACGARLLFPDGRLQHAGIEPMLWGFVSNFGVHAQAHDPRFASSGPCWAATGAMLAVRRGVFERVGGYDEGYRWGYEDVDLCLSVRARGAEVRYAADAIATHRQSATAGGWDRAADVAANYRRYRARWGAVLEPLEAGLLDRLRRSAVRRVVVLGTGLAARGLTCVLRDAGICVAALTALAPTTQRALEGLPVVPASELSRVLYDRLIVGTQFYAEIEQEADALDPTGRAIFPVLSTRAAFDGAARLMPAV